MVLVAGEAGRQGIGVKEDAEVLEQCGGAFQLVIGEWDVQELTEGGEVLGALVGVRGAHDENVIEVVMDVGDAPFLSEPLHCLYQAVKNRGG